jgi:hypothetical protein
MMRYVPEGDLEYQLQMMLNKGLTFVDNMDTVMLDVELDEGVNTVQHGLGRVPVGYIVVLKQNPGDIFGTETNSWTSESLLLLSNVTSQRARLIVL